MCSTVLNPKMGVLDVMEVGGSADVATPPAPVLCRYCFNLDHWVPVSLTTATVECRRCDVCPMYVPLGEWEEHADHGASSKVPILSCTACPLCQGIIPPHALVADCQLCALCNAYIPLHQLEQHDAEGCYGHDDPFA